MMEKTMMQVDILKLYDVISFKKLKQLPGINLKAFYCIPLFGAYQMNACNKFIPLTGLHWVLISMQKFKEQYHCS